jgi:hypothetical protein
VNSKGSKGKRLTGVEKREKPQKNRHIGAGRYPVTG